MELLPAQGKIYGSSIVQSAPKVVQLQMRHTLLGIHVILTNALEAAKIIRCLLEVKTVEK